MVRGREIQPRAPSLERQDEQTGNAVASVLKALHHLVSFGRGHAAMQEEYFVAEGGGKVPLQPLAHIDELREDQGRIAFCEQLLHHFGQTRQLSRAAGERRLIPQKLRGMIADLLEFGESRENDALAPDALGGLERARGLFDDTLIERGLLRCQVAEHLHLHFCREILNDGNVGFEAPQDERRRQLLQLQRGPGISPFLNGEQKPPPEFSLVTEKAGVQEVHDGPQFADVVLDRRAREGDPVIGRQGSRGARLARSRVLDVLRLVENDSGPGDLFQQIEVAMHERISGDDERMARGLLREFLAACARQSMMDEDREAGSKARRLLPPVANHRCGADEQHRAVDAVGMVALKQHKSLDGLSEAHVVGQASAQSVLPKKSEPGETAHLIRPEGTLKPVGGGSSSKRVWPPSFPSSSLSQPSPRASSN